MVCDNAFREIRNAIAPMFQMIRDGETYNLIDLLGGPETRIGYA